MTPTAPDRDTRAELLEQATDLIETQGFCAFSYADLAERIGIRKASIHHHFPSKADLGVAVVRRLHEHLRSEWRTLEETHAHVGERLRALFAHVREKASAGGRICPVGALQAELNALPEPVRCALLEVDAEHLAVLARWLEEGRRAGQLVFPGAPQAMAQVLVCVQQAALQRQRSNPAETADAALAQLQRLLGL